MSGAYQLPHWPDIVGAGLSGAVGDAGAEVDAPGAGRVNHPSGRRPVVARHYAAKGMASREAGAGVMVIYQAQ